MPNDELENMLETLVSRMKTAEVSLRRSLSDYEMKYSELAEKERQTKEKLEKLEKAAAEALKEFYYGSSVSTAVAMHLLGETGEKGWWENR